MMINSFTSNPAKKPIRNKVYFALLLISLFGISACKKQEVDNNVYGSLAVINASPTVATYDIYLSGSKINTAAIPAGGSVGYTQRVAGSHELKFTIAGRLDNVYTKTVSLPQDTYQTLFLVGRPTALEHFLITEDQTPTDSPNAFVRFINTVPDAPALDLFITGGASIVTNKAFKASSAFTQVAPGTYTFDVKETSNGTVKTTSESITLAKNVYYTVFVKGLMTPATNELPLSIQTIILR